MAAPRRGNTGSGTYFITASTFQKQQLLQSDRMAGLFLNVLLSYRSQEKYLLHEFALLPDHFHLLITPLSTLERTLQLIKGGFSFRAKRELGFKGEIWEKSFYDRRVRDWEEYSAFRQYIHRNPVKSGLVAVAEEYPYSSARIGLTLDAPPQRLKPSELSAWIAAVNRFATQNQMQYLSPAGSKIRAKIKLKGSGQERPAPHGSRGERPDASLGVSDELGSLRLRSGQALRLRSCYASRSGYSAQDDKLSAPWFIFCRLERHSLPCSSAYSEGSLGSSTRCARSKARKYSGREWR